MTAVQLPDLSQPQGDLTFLLGVILNQNIRSEVAWRGPVLLRQRLGHLDARRLAAMPHAELRDLLAVPAAIHPFAERMARNISGACSVLVERYGGRARNLWRGGPLLPELLRRLTELPGIGPHKAQVAVFLLQQQYGVRLSDGPIDEARAAALCPRLIVAFPRAGRHGHTNTG
jgi:uncharacterized HhH-GPD family protein